MYSKAVSPLLASIMLIAFTVAVGSIAYTFFTGYTQKTAASVTNATGGVIDCSQASMSLVSYKCAANTYRKPITVNNGGSALTDYQVRIVVDYSPKMNPTFSDLSFTYSGTNGEVPIPHWIENYTATNATVWVRTNLTSGDNVIFVYYGAGSQGTSNGTAVFDFFDDFSGPSVDTGKWNYGV